MNLYTFILMISILTGCLSDTYFKESNRINKEGKLSLVNNQIEEA